MTKAAAAWTVVPSTPKDIELIRKKCRRLVMRRAAISAGVSAVPIPGLDIVSDLSLLATLIEDINTEFGLTPAQIDRLQPKRRIAAYEMIVSMGSVMVGKVVTKALIGRLLQRTGMKILVKHSARLVPLAGQVVAAGIGFATFRAIGNQHIEACTSVAAELMTVASEPARGG